MTNQRAGANPARPHLGEFLSERQPEIIAIWTERVRAASPARDLSTAALIDHLPRVLKRIAEAVRSSDASEAASVAALATDHAVDRLSRGFDLDQIVTEYSHLRGSILDVWHSHIGGSIDVNDVQILDSALDESIRQSAVRYGQARERLLKALDRVSEAALGSSDLNVFLNDLIRATLDHTESVDTSVILLREGDVLRIRAAVGLEDDLDRGFSVRMREGFAGHVAAEGQPVFLRNAAADSRVKSEVIHKKGVRALYGVPLVHEGRVIGVAHIGSLTAYEFSEEDKLLFRTIASRATAIIVQAQLVVDLRRAETVQRFLSVTSKHFAESLDYGATVAKIAHLAVPAIADWCVVDVMEDSGIRRVSIAHADPSKESLARELVRHAPIYPNGEVGIPNVLRTGRSEFEFDVSDSALTSVAQNADHLRILRELGLKSYIIVPIGYRKQMFGAISLVTAESGRRYTEADVDIATELARRAATAIENTRLYSEAQGAIQLRERVLAVVSHDLRNQLGVISMAANLLTIKSAAAAGAAEIKKLIDTIERTSKNMEHLVGDLLDMASIQAGRLSLDLQPTELRPMLDESCQAHEPMTHAKGLDLRCDLAVDGVTVLCDRKRILQAVSNLLGNAIKFSGPGQSVTLRAEPRASDVLIAVADTGPGIPKAELQSIFEPYRTIQREGKAGTGLGLYITNGIIHRHGGHLWVESELQVGTTFFFTLPRAHEARRDS